MGALYHGDADAPWARPGALSSGDARATQHPLDLHRPAAPGHPGLHRQPVRPTPHLDALAAGGVRFDRCFVQNPLCAPSRASFLTGRYPRTTRMRQNGQTIPADELLVSRLLADAGYHCGMVGKLHTGATDAAAGFISEERRDDGYHYFQWSPKPFPDWRDPEDYSATNAYAHWLIEGGLPYPPTGPSRSRGPVSSRSASRRRTIRPPGARRRPSPSSRPTPAAAGRGCCR